MKNFIKYYSQFPPLFNFNKIWKTHIFFDGHLLYRQKSASYFKNIFFKYLIKDFESVKINKSEPLVYSCIIKSQIEPLVFRSLSTQFTVKFSLKELEDWSLNEGKYDHLYEMADIKTPLNLNQLYFKIRHSIQIMDTLYYGIIPLSVSLDLWFLPKLNTHYFKGIEKISYKNISASMNKRELGHRFNPKKLPLTMNEHFYGKLKKFHNFSKFYSGSSYNKFDKHSVTLTSARECTSEENNTLVVVYDLDKPTLTKKIFVFDLKTNQLIYSYLDELVDSNTFRRSSGNFSCLIPTNQGSKGEHLRTEQWNLLPPIKCIKRTKKELQIHSVNKNIGTFDLETFTDYSDDRSKVYSVGYALNNPNDLNSHILETFYIESDLDSMNIMVDCISKMLYTGNNCIYYTHNLSGYDVVFLLKALLKFNSIHCKEIFILSDSDYVMKDNNIIKLKIKVNKENFIFLLSRLEKRNLISQDYYYKKYIEKISHTKSTKKVYKSITLQDSLSLLPASLESLGDQFCSNFKKGYFPYSFVTNKTLFYQGITPAIDYYHTGKRDLGYEEYSKLIKYNWNMKSETLLYLERDLQTLLEIMNTFNDMIFLEYNLQLTKFNTISSLSLKMFLYNHIGQKELGLIKKRDMYNDLKKGYYGGLSEVYKSYGENLYYYDVNSLYPFAALNDMPGREYCFVEDYSKKGLSIEKDNLFGFFYCQAETSYDYIGLLPVRINGLLCYPLGKFEGWFFSPLIKLAQSYNYKIKIIKGYNFIPEKEVFNSYVNTLYKEKQTSTGAKRTVVKFLLNSMLGRFGLVLDKRVTDLLNREQYLNLLTSHEIYDEKWIIEDEKVLVTYNPYPDVNICLAHGVDYIDLLNNLPKKKKTFWRNWYK